MAFEERNHIHKRVLDDLCNLLLTHYPKAKEALLEADALSDLYLLGALMDLRDFIDHIYLALKQDPDDDTKKLEHHLSSAEEHLRRAISEPYQALIHEKMETIENLYNKYRGVVFHTFKWGGASDVISPNDAKERLREIRELLLQGRTQKSSSIWNERFEDAITKCFIPALKKAEELETQLYIAVDRKIKVRDRIILAVSCSFIAAALLYIIKTIGAYFLG